MSYVFRLILFIFPIGSAWAQLNESDTALWQMKVGVTGVWQGGNVELLAIRGKLDASFSPNPDWAFKTQNAYLYQSFFNNRADEDIFSRNFLYYQPRKMIYPFLISFISTNFRRKIDFRQFSGAGASWQILRGKNGQTVKTALSGVYETSRFSVSQFNEVRLNGNDRIDTWRATAWLFGRHSLLSKTLVLHYEGYFQPSLEDAENIRWQVEAGLDVPLRKGWAFTINWIYTYESIIAQRLQNHDRILTFGFNFSK
jgi:hypothetical protein